MTADRQTNDLDTPWKEALERFFEAFVRFFFPHIHRSIDWTRPPEFLDKELAQVARDAELGVRLVDKLVKVQRNDGDTEWVLIHVEVQGQPDPGFAERMYVYNYRLFDRYHRRVCSVAVLADDRKRWRPTAYRRRLWGCEASLTYPVAKLLDHLGREDALSSDPNPFALVVLAHLATRATSADPHMRSHAKLNLIRRLISKGFAQDDVLELLRFLDWIMVLPEELEQRLWDRVAAMNRERHMPYVSNFERFFMERGLKKGIEAGMQRGLDQGRKEGRKEGRADGVRLGLIEVLRRRFDHLPDGLEQRIGEVTDVEQLQRLLASALEVERPEQLLDQLSAPT